MTSAAMRRFHASLGTREIFDDTHHRRRTREWVTKVTGLRGAPTPDEVWERIWFCWPLLPTDRKIRVLVATLRWMRGDDP